MKPKTIVLMVVAVGCGLAASYMTSKLLADRKQPAEEEKVVVLVAKAKVPRFTVVKDPDKYFEQRQVPRSAAPKGTFFSSPDEIKGKRLNREVKADAHVTPEDLMEKASTALPIPDGFGAIGLTVNASSAVGYFVFPGDRVDVILTQRGQNASAQTILRDVLVLSVADQIVRPEDGNTRVLQANTVTVALNDEDAQLVRLSETLGDLSLRLRKEGDSTDKRSAKVTTVRDLVRAGLDLTASTAGRAEAPRPSAGGTELPPIPKAAEKKDPPKDPEKKEPEKKEPEKKEPERKDPPRVAEDEPKDDPVRPAWTITYEAGALPAKATHFYQRPDGSLTKDESDPALREPKRKPKKDEPSETK